MKPPLKIKVLTIGFLCTIVFACSNAAPQKFNDTPEVKGETAPKVKSKKVIIEDDFRMFKKATKDKRRAFVEKHKFIIQGDIYAKYGKHDINLLKANAPIFVEIYGLAEDTTEVDVLIIDGDNKSFLTTAKRVAAELLEINLSEPAVYNVVLQENEKETLPFKLKVKAESNPVIVSAKKVMLAKGSEVALPLEGSLLDAKLYLGAKQIEKAVFTKESVSFFVPSDINPGVIRIRQPGKVFSNGVLYLLSPRKPINEGSKIE